MTTRAERAARRRAIEAEFGPLFPEVARILFDHAPVRTGSPHDDEYEGEAQTILPRLKDARDAADVQAIVHEEFVRWFTPITAGPVARYAAVAEAIWAAYRRHVDT